MLSTPSHPSFCAIDSIKQGGVDSISAAWRFRRMLLLGIHEGAYESISRDECQRDLYFWGKVPLAIHHGYTIAILRRPLNIARIYVCVCKRIANVHTENTRRNFTARQIKSWTDKEIRTLKDNRIPVPWERIERALIVIMMAINRHSIRFRVPTGANHGERP